MRGQSRRHSVFESVANIAAGMIVALVTQSIVFPWLHIPVSAAQNFKIVVIFTAVSFVRSYCLRRMFNWFHIQIDRSRETSRPPCKHEWIVGTAGGLAVVADPSGLPVESVCRKCGLAHPPVHP